MIPTSQCVDQETLTRLREADPLVMRYRALFAQFNWSVVPEAVPDPQRSGRRAHPESAYVKALLVKINERFATCTQLRSFLVEHPLLVLELGFRLKEDSTTPYGFDVEATVPCERWFRHKQQTLDQGLLQNLLAETVHTLQAEIPGLGETVAVDVKHIYAWVKENNPKAYVSERFDPEAVPLSGDPDCRLGVKRSSNQEQPDGTTHARKEYVWGYGSGVVAATTPEYGDVVIAEYTQPFNEVDKTYYHPLYEKTVKTLGFRPKAVTADAAFDSWDVYQTCAEHGGLAAIPLNLRGHEAPDRTADGIPRCARKLPMHPSYQFAHTNGYQAQRFICPLLFPNATGVSCDHEQFLKGKGCVKEINIEPGGIMRATLDRDSAEYKTIYRQRTSTERINSQAKDYGIERPRVRNQRSVTNLNTLTYLIINAHALQRVKSINKVLSGKGHS